MKTLALLAALATLGATEAYGQYVTCPPVCGTPVVTAPAVYHNIHNDGPIRSRQDVWVKLPSGKHMKVPVINGILPSIQHRTWRGSDVYDFYYNTGVAYKGGIPSYEPDTGERKVGREVERKPVPRTAPMFREDVGEERRETKPTPVPDQELQELRSRLLQEQRLRGQQQAELERTINSLQTELQKMRAAQAEKAPAPSMDELRLLQEQMDGISRSLKSLETKTGQPDPGLQEMKHTLDGLKVQVEELKNPPVEKKAAPGFPRLIDPEEAIPQNDTKLPMRRPSELKKD